METEREAGTAMETATVWIGAAGGREDFGCLMSAKTCGAKFVTCTAHILVSHASQHAVPTTLYNSPSWFLTTLHPFLSFCTASSRA